MDFSSQAIDKIIEATGVAYEYAKTALSKAEGDIEAAIDDIKANGVENTLEGIKEKLTQVINSGKAKKITVRKNGETVLSVPLNAGIIGGVLGLAYAPVAVIAAAIAAYGFDCRIEIENKDGTTEEFSDTENQE